MAFYKRIMVPGNAALVVVGDVEPDAITAALESRLRAWAPGPAPHQPGTSVATGPVSAGQWRLPDRQAGRGPVGPDRRQDRGRPQIARFLRLRVHERDPGRPVRQPDQHEPSRGQGLQLRAESSFSFFRGPGPFEAGGHGPDRGHQGVAGRDLQGADRHHRPAARHRRRAAFAKQRIIQGFPAASRRRSASPARSRSWSTDDLPDDEFAHYQARVEAVTKADVDRVAREYITPETMTILVVGDRSQIEGPLKSLPFVETIQRLDTEGNPLPAPAAKPAAAAGAGSAARIRASGQ